jgi:phage shock protein A
MFSRLSDIVNANLNSLLDKAEDPEKIVRLMIQEMEDTLVEVRSAAAKVIAERKERERQLSVLDQEQLDWEHKAELALRKNREDLAKAALQHKAALGDQSKLVASDLVVLGTNLAKLNDDIAKLQAKLQDAKARQRTIVLRAQNAHTSLKARTQIHSARIDDMLNRFDYAERRIDAVEAQAEALDLGRAKTLNQAFTDLEAEDRIKNDLEALKARVQKPRGPAAETQDSADKG